MPSQPEHVPVMLGRVLALLRPALDVPDSVFVDMTLGLAGHSIEFLRACPTARLVGLDRDPGAVEIARTRLAEFGDRVELVHADNDRLPSVLAGLGIERVHAVLFDLGVSSMQLDEDDRGFSYSRDVGLDMRMNPLHPTTAATVLAEYSAADLTRILRVYGEERFAQRIATAIVRRRETSPLTTTGELAALVASAVPAAARRTGSGHPAKKTFQAVRIEVNAELDVLTSRAAGRDRRPSRGRADRCAVVPLARGPDHQADAGRVRDHLGARRCPGRPGGVPAQPQAVDAWSRESRRSRDRRQPTCTLGATARCRSYQGGRVSASNLSTTPVRRRAETTSPPWLRLVPSVPVDAPRAPFIVFVIAVLGVGLVGLLLLNTSLQKRAFEVSSLQRSTAALADQQSELGQHAADLSAPESVAALAVELGMVPNKNPVFLRLSDGKRAR